MRQKAGANPCACSNLAFCLRSSNFELHDVRTPCTYQGALLSGGDTQLSRFLVPAGQQMGEVKQDSEAADRGVNQLRVGLDMSLEETDGVSCTC